MMGKKILLARRPDLARTLEKHGLLPLGKPESRYCGCAKKWAAENIAPYDTSEAQALAARLPEGWEEIGEEEFNALIQKVNDKTASLKKIKKNIPDRRGSALLKNLTKVALLGISVTFSTLIEQGITTLPEKNEGEKERANRFSFELILQLINSSGLLDSLFKEISRTTVTTEKYQKLLAEILKLLSLIMAIITASKGRQEVLNTLTGNFKAELLQGFNHAERFVNERLLEGKLTGGHAEGAALFLQQARIALEKEDHEGLNAIVNDGLGLLDVEPDAVFDELKILHELAGKLYVALTSGLRAEITPQTTMSQAM